MLPRDAPVYVALFDGLSRLGFVEGQNLQIDGQGFELRPGQFAQHAAELVKAKIDVIECTTLAVRAVQRATVTVPIITVTE